MIKVERQGQIQRLLQARGTVSVREIASGLGVSDMTIRRDLEELAADGVLERVHGGARLPSGDAGVLLPREYSNSEKRVRNTEAKREIARTAVGLIREHDTVSLGTGTTIEQMVPMLPVCRLRIVTNSLSVFNLLEAHEEYELCLVGGIYRRRTAAFVGPLAEEAVTSLGISVAFVGVNGIVGGTASTSSMEEGRLQTLALNAADRRYLVADQSKIGKRDFYSFYKLRDATAVICEEEAAEEVRRTLGDMIEVLTG